MGPGWGTVCLGLLGLGVEFSCTLQLFLCCLSKGSDSQLLEAFRARVLGSTFTASSSFHSHALISDFAPASSPPFQDPESSLTSPTGPLPLGPSLGHHRSQSPQRPAARLPPLNVNLPVS